jgi:hypothetical protein
MIYAPSRIRATAAEMAERKAMLYEIVAEQMPMTVRQVFYQAVVRGLIEKTEQAYERIQRTLVQMRREGYLSYGWISDNTRSVYRVRSFNDAEDVVRRTAEFYRKSLWADVDVHVEVWIEKDALAGVVRPITYEWDVGLYVCRGFASLSFIHAAAEEIDTIGKPARIYHLGDHDPSGVTAANKICETLFDLTSQEDIRFTRLAVLPDQIAAWSLPTRQSSHSRDWEGDSVELDAIAPDELRWLVQRAIEQHLPHEQFEVLKAAEESERELLRQWAGEPPEGETT